MAKPPLADVTELARRIGRYLNEGETLRAEAALADASALVRAETGQDWLNDDGTLAADVPDIAVSIVLAVAQRRFSNPSGHVSETMGPFSYRVAGGDETAGIFLTDGERRMLRALRASRGGVITLTSPYSGVPATYVPVEGGGDLMPWPTEYPYDYPYRYPR